jgi:hypothetical protein
MLGLVVLPARTGAERGAPASRAGDASERREASAGANQIGIYAGMARAVARGPRRSRRRCPLSDRFPPPAIWCFFGGAGGSGGLRIVSRGCKYRLSPSRTAQHVGDVGFREARPQANIHHGSGAQDAAKNADHWLRSSQIFCLICGALIGTTLDWLRGPAVATPRRKPFPAAAREAIVPMPRAKCSKELARHAALSRRCPWKAQCAAQVSSDRSGQKDPASTNAMRTRVKIRVRIEALGWKWKDAVKMA